MIFDGVYFNEQVIRTMTREVFESKHIKHFWLNRDETTRQNMLGQVYDIITKPAKKNSK